MTCAESLHNFITNYNVLKTATDQIETFLNEHPEIKKVALLVNHIFRAIAMLALRLFLPFSLLVNDLICFAGSLFYRLTVETHCAYKFALPAFAGSMAIPLAHTALYEFISGVAFASLATFGVALLSLIPLAAYTTYIILTVSYDVDN